VEVRTCFCVRLECVFIFASGFLVVVFGQDKFYCMVSLIMFAYSGNFSVSICFIFSFSLRIFLSWFDVRLISLVHAALIVPW